MTLEGGNLDSWISGMRIPGLSRALHGARGTMDLADLPHQTVDKADQASHADVWTGHGPRLLVPGHTPMEERIGSTNQEISCGMDRRGDAIWKPTMILKTQPFPKKKEKSILLCTVIELPWTLKIINVHNRAGVPLSLRLPPSPVRCVDNGGV